MRYGSAVVVFIVAAAAIAPAALPSTLAATLADYDDLQPYPPGQFGPRPGHHAARRRAVFGENNRTYETFPSSRVDPPSMPQVDYIVQPIFYSLRMGHVTYADNPLRMFSVYEPPGGCPVPLLSPSSLALPSVSVTSVSAASASHLASKSPSSTSQPLLATSAAEQHNTASATPLMPTSSSSPASSLHARSSSGVVVASASTVGLPASASASQQQPPLGTSPLSAKTTPSSALPSLQATTSLSVKESALVGMSTNGVRHEPGDSGRRERGAAASTPYSADTRSRPSITAREKHCIVAGNGGFFNTANGACYGNIVSDGRIVQTSPWHNANFGLRRDGTFVVGYIDEAMVNDITNPFVQLVAGVIWLVRNGTNFVSESADVEDLSHQETGRAFVTVRSARTAIGHDAHGRLVMAQIDGKTSVTGIALSDFADLLISKGVVNAVNLDGGGSGVVVLNGTVSNYPSDGPPLASQERPVTTVVCMHAPTCDPPCANNGTCAWGVCECASGYSGVTCEVPVDACDAVDSPCPPSFRCVVAGPGRKECVCDANYESVVVYTDLNGGHGAPHCKPVNVCAGNPGLCGDNAVCVFDGPAKHVCVCHAGYARNASVPDACVDVDECMQQHGGGGCSPHATCHNYPGGHLCVCGGDFSGNGTSCLPVSFVASLAGCHALIIGLAFTSILALAFGIIAAALGYDRLRLRRLGLVRNTPEAAAFLRKGGGGGISYDDDNEFPTGLPM
eukprot:Opistho-2@7534